jgi:acyl-coenzyme A synthetase/AMP-(fatty) acid ligase
VSGESTSTPAVEFPIAEIETILEQATVGAISAEEYAKLGAVIATFALLKEELQSKKTSIQSWRRMVFGPRIERTRDVLGEEPTYP